MPQSLSAREDLVARGFTGFVSVAALRAKHLEQVPEHVGVYAVLRESAAAPSFLPRSTGGRFKDRDPSVPVQMLEQAWNPGNSLMYIGKANRRPLRRRLRQYLDFGAGRPVGHWGGRYVWHLGDADQLLVAWKETNAAEAPKIEKSLLGEFQRLYGKRPFANLAEVGAESEQAD